MNITKVPDKDNIKLRRKELANMNCDICPFCKESRTFGISKGKAYGIMHGLISSRQATGFLGLGKGKTADLYSCMTCGAKWESDLY